MAQTLVSFSRVAKRFKSFTALEDVTFSVNEGEIFGYIGPNGAGKTTTIKLLVGLLTHFEGEIKVGELTLPRELMKLHKLVGYLPQSPEFQTWRTINHALVTFGRLNGMSDHDINARIPVLLERFELGEWRHKKNQGPFWRHEAKGRIRASPVAQAQIVGARRTPHRTRP